MKKPINIAAHPHPAAEQIAPSTKAANAPSEESERRLYAKTTITTATNEPAIKRETGEREKLKLSPSPARRLQ
jgi:hypothetical protein